MYERGPAGNVTGYVPPAIPHKQQSDPPLQNYPSVDQSLPAQQSFAAPVQPAPPQAMFPQNAAPAATPAPTHRETQSSTGFFRRRSTLLLISAILCTLYLLLCHQAIAGMLEANPVGETAEELSAALGTALGAALLTPFMWISFIGQLFNWFGWGFNRRGLALTGAILYSVALLLGFSWGLGLIPSVVLSYVGYARLRRRQLADHR